MAFVALILPLTGCTKASAKAEREYQIMLKGGAPGDQRCAKLREIAAAYLAEENEKEYPLASVTADIECQGVELRRRGY